MKAFYLIIPALLVLMACGDDDAPSQQPTNEVIFSNGFEASGGNINDLFPSDNTGWTNLQQVDPTGGPTNTIELRQDEVNSGAYSLYFQAFSSENPVSKADIEKGGLQLLEGEKVEISAWFFIKGNNSLQNLTLIDLECCQCWDPDVPDNQCPGVRLQMSGGNDFLVMERGKIALTTLSQNDIRFPRDRWVNVRWVLTLSDLDDGLNQLYIDDQLVLDATGINMPNQEIFADLFAQEGINFQLQTPLFYERIQFGATANTTGNTVELYVDDVEIRRLEN